MSKVRRDKHKVLVFWSQIGKALDRVDNGYNKPRWRQWEKQNMKGFSKNEQNRPYIIPHHRTTNRKIHTSQGA